LDDLHRLIDVVDVRVPSMTRIPSLQESVKRIMRDNVSAVINVDM